MVNNPNTSNSTSSSAHGNSREPQHSNPRSNSKSNSKRFPDYILMGSLNLHKSPVNAAALAKYIATQWAYLRINRNGIISSKQLEINRNPEAYGGLREGKPLTVTEWNKIQRAKLIEKRKQLADIENETNPNTAAAGANGVSNATRGSNRGKTRSSSRGSRGSGRGRSRGRGRGRGPTRADRAEPPAVLDNIIADNNVASTSAVRTRSRGRGRPRGRARGPSRASRAGTDQSVAPTINVNLAKDASSAKASAKHITLNVKQPKLAKRNLRDKGNQLPRKRGPDKPPPIRMSQNPSIAVVDGNAEAEQIFPTKNINSRDRPGFEVVDEVASDTEVMTHSGGNIQQLDGNDSPSSCESDSDDNLLKDIYKPLVFNTTMESESSGLSTTHADGMDQFRPAFTSTQEDYTVNPIPRHNSPSQAPDLQGLDNMLRTIRNNAETMSPHTNEEEPGRTTMSAEDLSYLSAGT